jgi:hypothetical protein
MKTQRSRSTVIAEREGLCSVSNNTRWRAALEAIKPLGCRVRIKYIDVESPTEWHFGVWSPHPRYVEGTFGPSEFTFVEWLEIESVARRHLGGLVKPAVIDHEFAISSALVAAKSDFERTADGFRIFGYRRSQQ